MSLDRGEVYVLLLQRYRRENPRARANQLTPYRINTGRRRCRGCVVCGARGVSWCGDYRETKRAIAWFFDHPAIHVDETIRYLRTFAARKLCTKAKPKRLSAGSLVGCTS